MRRLSGGSADTGSVLASGRSTAIPHGGDLDEPRRLFPGAPEPWIDLSTGINPVPYPVPALPPEAFTRLPSRADQRSLEEVAGRAYGVEAETVVAAPGTQILISLLPRFVQRGTVAILGPTYAEHAAAWQGAGHAIRDADRAEELLDADCAVVVDPNNPDGGRISSDTVQSLAAACGARGGILVVDEAFADLEQPNGLGAARPPSCVVLRSFGKTYGLAGVRLGFAIAEPSLADKIRRALGPWAVSGPAVAIGRAALADGTWLRAAARGRRLDAERLDGLLLAAGGRVVGGTRLFRTADFPDAAAIADRLGRLGIWVRRFEANPARLRFGLPAPEVAWSRLESGLLGRAT